jgi:hypothetical protein
VLENGFAGGKRDNLHTPKRGGKARLRNVFGEAFLQFGQSGRGRRLLAKGREGEKKSSEDFDQESVSVLFHENSDRAKVTCQRRRKQVAVRGHPCPQQAIPRNTGSKIGARWRS